MVLEIYRILEKFYLFYSGIKKVQTVSAQFKTSQIRQSQSAEPSTQSFLEIQEKAPEIFPLPWSAYVQLLSVQDKDARKFYEEEALREVIESSPIHQSLFEHPHFERLSRLLLFFQDHN